ncbi:MAG: ABC transporter substrate-binding protein [Thermomicrobiales bacterium]|nr:ABC transporter substrate-binding protein [Thermomicrobiales bacterium]
MADQATPGPVAPGSTIVVPPGLRTDLAGTPLNCQFGYRGPDTAFDDAATRIFAEATGIEAVHTIGDASVTDQLTQILTQLGAQTSDVDVYQIDVIWPGIIAEHAVDLSASLAAQAKLMFPEAIANDTVGGVLVGMPWINGAGLLFYRTDLLEAYGFAAPPATWSELETQAAAVQTGERAAGASDFQGFVWQGNAYEGLTCDALEWQASSGGGSIIEPDGTVSVDNERAAAAMERAARWVGTISPPGVTTYEEPDCLNLFATGNALFMRNWPYAWNASQDVGSAIAGRVGVAALPAGDEPGNHSAAALGGFALMVSRYSQHQDAALEFVKYLTSPELQRSYVIERGNLPTIASVYDDPAVAAASEFVPRLRPIFEGGTVARPSSVAGPFYNDVSVAYQAAVHQILTGSLEASPALKDLAGELETIMADLKG